jgi:hypothetical protein
VGDAAAGANGARVTDTEPAPEGGPDARPEATPPARPRGLLVPLLALAAGVLLVTTATFGVLAVRYKSERDESVDERTAVGTTAGELMDAMLDYDYRTPDRSLAAVLDLASGDFASQYEEASSSIAQAYEALGATSRGTIHDVFVGDVSANGSAVAIVLYDQVVSGDAGTNTALGCYARLALAQGPDKWTVNKVDLIGCATGDIGSPVGGSTTTTAPPTTATP